MKRARDCRLEKHLGKEGFLILGHQEQDPEVAEALGLPRPVKGQFVSIRVHPADPGDSPVAEIRGSHGGSLVQTIRPSSPQAPALPATSLSDGWAVRAPHGLGRSCPRRAPDLRAPRSAARSTLRFECGLLLGIALRVPGDLRAPVLGVRPGLPPPVLLAAMPPAAVDEAADQRPGEHDVRAHRPAPSARSRVDAVPESARVQQRSDRELRPSVSPPVRAHVGAPMRRARRRRYPDRHSSETIQR